MKVTIDFETRSEVDLKKVGASAYSEHDSTEILCLAFKYGDSPTRIWLNTDIISPDWILDGDDCPARSLLLERRVNHFPVFGLDCLIEAHNAFFERNIWKNIVVKRMLKTPIPDQRWRCSMAKSCALSLPASLDLAAKAIRLPVEKDLDGRRIMLKLCKPRKPTKNNPDKWHEDPKDFTKLAAYCIQDVDVEYQLSNALMDLSPKEQKLWHLDQKINMKGIKTDQANVKKALTLVEKHTESLNLRLSEITSGEILTSKQTAKILSYLDPLKMPNLQAQTVKRFLKKKNLDPIQREVLDIRACTGATATAKLKTLLAAACEDLRIKGSLIYHKAGTGRWAGTLVQPHNMPRGVFKDVDSIFHWIEDENLDALSFFYGDPISAISSCVRGMLIPGDGKDFICGDFKSIEAITVASLAGEEKVLGYFREGLDLYKVAAMDIYHKTYEDINSDERQIGKVAVLALGYQGGVGAFQSMAKNYGVIISDAEAKSIVDNWRASNENTVSFWYAMENIVLKVLTEKKDITWKNITWFLRKHGRINLLHCKLPSGRIMSYASPSVKEVDTPWGQRKLTAHYWGLDTYTKKWSEMSTYGGKLVENITQAVARDFLVEAMFNLVDTKYEIVLTMHDEILAEVPENEGSLDEFKTIMTKPPKWAKDMPLNASGWRGKRYRK